MKNHLPPLTLAFATLTTALTATGALAAGPPPTPAPKILVIDRNAILEYSRVGQDITRQVQAFSTQARNSLDGRAKALAAEGQALQQKVAILSAAQKDIQVRAFQARQAALQADAQKQEAAIQGGFMQARATVEKALGPILQQIIQQRGANMVLDKQAVVFATNNGFDITPDAINALNQKLSSVKVTLAPPPAPPKK